MEWRVQTTTLLTATKRGASEMLFLETTTSWFPVMSENNPGWKSIYWGLDFQLGFFIVDYI